MATEPLLHPGEEAAPADPAAPAGPALTFRFAKARGVLVSEQSDHGVTLACRADARSESILEAMRALGMPAAIEVVAPEVFAALLQRRYEGGATRSREMVEGIGDELNLAEAAQALAEPADLLDAADDAPIIRLINALFAEAIREGASDIHIEPFENRVVVRFRVDGLLREVLSPPKALAKSIVSRVKVMARLDIAEKRLPLDGRISLRIAGRPVDVRVSTLPSGDGERVVLRLLDKQAGRLDLNHLGMEPAIRERLDELIRRPHGIILVTGPTGSGKTTTLYASLGRLNNSSRNVMTVEDPVEYDIDGISQTQVNLKVDLSFARGLRAILRQDPDVVMVGEIRDLETAQIAVQASLTGHLVLSTLHTNTAVGAVTRLRDMGTEPFLLASSLLAVIAQRLVRLLCDRCKEPYLAQGTETARLGLTGDSELFRARGCPHCNYSGYRGRTGIYELVVVDEEMRTMIHDNAAQSALERQARRLTPSIIDDGRRRVLAGDTTLEEVLRVSQEG
ncbi:MAG: type II secretion system ATPase GspE [Pseudomonadota bacterium]|nr:type II secretion system ATPase GspE [Pseudomonadota bacterium]